MTDIYNARTKPTWKISAEILFNAKWWQNHFFMLAILKYFPFFGPKSKNWLHSGTEILGSRSTSCLPVRLSAISLATSKTGRNFGKKASQNFLLMLSWNQIFLGILLLIKVVFLVFTLKWDDKGFHYFRGRFLIFYCSSYRER